MRFEKVERIAMQLAALASGAAAMRDMCWLQNCQTGDGCEGDYCDVCAHRVADWYNGTGEKPDNAQMIPDLSNSGAHFSVDGTCGYEDDGPRYCQLCGAELDVTILTGDGELDHWEVTAPKAPGDWRILGRLFESYKPHMLRKKPYLQRPSELHDSRERAARLLWILRRYSAA